MILKFDLFSPGDWRLKFLAWYSGKTYTATNYSIDHQKYLDVQFSPGRKVAVDIYDPKFYFPSDKAQAPTLQRSV